MMSDQRIRIQVVCQARLTRMQLSRSSQVKVLAMVSAMRGSSKSEEIIFLWSLGNMVGRKETKRRKKGKNHKV